ncbi:MAG: sigma-54-dependent Fis family transcriptional regulator [Colwelliaceae bacterium]|nr:sigma-54-dependent Fis family transcriptional regulator [Colwelliaceae bacterium]
MSYKVLLADDDKNILAALKLQLKVEGFSSVPVTSPNEVLSALKEQDFDLILMDLNYHHDTTSGDEGLNLISEIRKNDQFIPIVAMTGWGTIDIAVDAMRRGANDFIEKPCDNNRLLNILKNLLALSESQKRSQRLASENELLRSSSQPQHWTCQSDAMKQVMTVVNNVAATDINILITGENGTGKSQLANIIHQLSLRKASSFITVNMGAINDAIFESELFGHVKGSFTDAKANRIGRFELADNGSLFMDEVANIPLGQQAKLLRVLESGEFEKLGSSKSQKASVRIISATNADLEDMVSDKNFRQDLLFRLNSIEINIPPLRDRQADIPVLANNFLKKYNHKYQRNIDKISVSAMDKLLAYQWPGNIRELDHLIERAILMATSTELQADDLLIKASATQDKNISPNNENDEDWAQLSMEQAEGKLIALVMKRFHGNAKDAAKSLGYSKSSFYRRLEKFGL